MDDRSTESEIGVLEVALASLVNERCWKVVGGPALGSRVTFHFGAAVTHYVGVPPTPMYLGECSFGIGCAEWRLAREGRLLATSSDLMVHGGAPYRALQELVGQRVAKFELFGPFDVRLWMSDESELSVLCNASEDGLDQYTVCVGKQYVTVECHEGRLVVLDEFGDASV